MEVDEYVPAGEGSGSRELERRDDPGSCQFFDDMNSRASDSELFQKLGAAALVGGRAPSSEPANVEATRPANGEASHVEHENPSVSENMGRGCRRKPGLPRRFRDELPAPPPRIPQRPPSPPREPSTPAQESRSPSPVRIVAPPLETIRTETNKFGLYREYIGRPTHDPDEFFDVNEVSDVPQPEDEGNADRAVDELPWHTPASSATAFRMVDWSQNNSTTKSQADTQLLVDEVINAPDFNLEDAKSFNIQRELERIDHEEPEPSTIENLTATSSHSGWKETTVPIEVPDGKKRSSWDDLTEFIVKRLAMRRLWPIIKEAFENDEASKYHLTPFREFFQSSPDVSPQRVYGESFTTDEFIKAHEEINALPREEGDNYERVVVSLMLWSDSTRLAQFGSASLWPLYLYFGNESKYSRACPNAHACHHVAYLPKVSLHSICTIKKLSMHGALVTRR